MGVAVGRLRQQRALQPLRDQLRRGVQRALPQRGRRTSPTCPSARRRRPAACPTWAGARRSSTTTTTAGWTSSWSTATSIPQLDQARLRRLRRLPAAPAAVPQPRRRHLRRGGGAATGPVLTEERVSRGLAVGDLDDDGRLDVVINDLDGAPQVLRNEIADRRALAARASSRARAGTPNAIGAVVTREERAASPRGGSCRAGRATSRRTTCARTSAWGRRTQADARRGALARRHRHHPDEREGGPGAGDPSALTAD